MDGISMVTSAEEAAAAKRAKAREDAGAHSRGRETAVQGGIGGGGTGGARGSGTHLERRTQVGTGTGRCNP